MALTAVSALLMTGCQSSQSPKTASKPASIPEVKKVDLAPITIPCRIKAGQEAGFTDSSGNVWIGERGFQGGDVIERPDVELPGVKDPQLYRSEHYSMDSFSEAVPNGKYIVKLHFCETFEGVEEAGQRVFTFAVGNKEFKGFDVFAKAGGVRKPYVETVNTEVTNGKLEVKFTPEIENPQINGIEILPAN